MDGVPGVDGATGDPAAVAAALLLLSSSFISGLSSFVITGVVASLGFRVYLRERGSLFSSSPSSFFGVCSGSFSACAFSAASFCCCFSLSFGVLGVGGLTSLSFPTGVLLSLLGVGCLDFVESSFSSSLTFPVRVLPSGVLICFFLPFPPCLLPSSSLSYSSSSSSSSARRFPFGVCLPFPGVCFPFSSPLSTSSSSSSSSSDHLLCRLVCFLPSSSSSSMFSPSDSS